MVLVFELTGSLDALLSVTIVSILAYVVANLLRVDPYYEHLLADLLGVTPDDPSINGEPGEKVLKTAYVGSGSRLEGMRVSEVPWPDGTRIVTIDRAGQEIVPNGLPAHGVQRVGVGAGVGRLLVGKKRVSCLLAQGRGRRVV